MLFCDICETLVSADAEFCPSSGRQLRPATLQPSPPPQPAPTALPKAPEAKERMTPTRPAGVTILTALAIIGGIVDLGAAVFSLVVATVYFSWVGVIARLGGTGLVLSLASYGSLVAGIFSFVPAYGLWNGRSWAWIWTFIFSIMRIIVSIFGIAVGIGIIRVAISAVMIYYLTRARVRSFFGKASIAAQS